MFITLGGCWRYSPKNLKIETPLFRKGQGTGHGFFPYPDGYQMFFDTVIAVSITQD
jgi:hypothetical protein